MSTRPHEEFCSVISQAHPLGKVVRRLLSKNTLERLQKQYPVGCWVELLQMEEAAAPPIGTKGTATGIDSTGSIMVDWDNDSDLNVLYGIDRVRK